ncbi:hypothetical protein [Mycoplasma hafezii]|uniref:hypothetical protein n=1 Tax=Mycoplasma hafezii TaxID=525886 RepID=UPI003CF12A8F
MKFRNKINLLLLGSLTSVAAPIIGLSASCDNTEKNQTEKETKNEEKQSNTETKEDVTKVDEKQKEKTDESKNDEKPVLSVNLSEDAQKELAKAADLVAKFNDVEFTNDAAELGQKMAEFGAKLAQGNLSEAEANQELANFRVFIAKMNNRYGKGALLQALKDNLQYIQEWYLKTHWFGNPIKEQAIKTLKNTDIQLRDTTTQTASALKSVLETKKLYQEAEAKLNLYLNVISNRDKLTLIMNRLEPVAKSLTGQAATDATEFMNKFKEQVATRKLGKNSKVKILYKNSEAEMQAALKNMNELLELASTNILPALIDNIKLNATLDLKGWRYQFGWYNKYTNLLKQVKASTVNKNSSTEEILELFNLIAKANEVKQDTYNFISLLAGRGSSDKASAKYVTLDINKKDHNSYLRPGEVLVQLPDDKNDRLSYNDPKKKAPTFVGSLAPELPIAYQNNENWNQYNKFKDLRNAVISSLFTLNTDPINGKQVYLTKVELGQTAWYRAVTWLINSIDFAIQTGLLNDEIYEYLYGELPEKITLNTSTTIEVQDSMFSYVYLTHNSSALSGEKSKKPAKPSFSKEV